MKKVIAIIMSCIMLISISPVVAAEGCVVTGDTLATELTPNRSIEEILSNYHQRINTVSRQTATVAQVNTNQQINLIKQETISALNSKYVTKSSTAPFSKGL